VDDEVAEEDGKGDETSIWISSITKTLTLSTSDALGAIFVVSVLKLILLLSSSIQ
jgi:hypothetical protein